MVLVRGIKGGGGGEGGGGRVHADAELQLDMICPLLFSFFFSKGGSSVQYSTMFLWCELTEGCSFMISGVWTEGEF